MPNVQFYLKIRQIMNNRSMFVKKRSCEKHHKRQFLLKFYFREVEVSLLAKHNSNSVNSKSELFHSEVDE
jgi:hypothetical protein